MIGAAAGVAAYLLVNLIALLTNVLLFGEVDFTYPDLAELEPSIRLPLVAVAGALVITTMALWAPMIRGHGIPEAMEAVLRRQSRIPPRAAIAKPTSAAIAIGTGAPFGAEGPVLNVTPSERKILLAAGAAGGMSAIFGAPLAAVLLAVELLLFELSVRSLIPLVVASSIAGGVHSALFGTGPLFVVPPHEYAGLSKLPLYAVLGLSCGLLAVVIARGFFATERFYRWLPVPRFWHPLIGALGFAAIGLVQPRALGLGYETIDEVLAGELALATLASVLVAKMLAWWIALGSGTSGGTLAPLLLMSATFGGLFAAVADAVAPGLDISPGAFAVVGMAAVFGAAIRAPLTAIVFVFELTRDFEVLLPLMLASVLAALVTSMLLEDSLFTEKLSRRGIRVGGELRADPLSTTAVTDVMNRAVDTLPPTATAGDVAERISRGGPGAYPVVDDDGHCVGIVSRQDLLDESLPDDAPLSEVASTDVVTIDPDASLFDAFHLMENEGISHLPVVENDVVVGICTRADLLRARGQDVALERTELGWLAPVLRRVDQTGPRCLVVANRTLGSTALMREITDRAAVRTVRFHVVVPVADGDLTTARRRLEEQLEALEEIGLEGTGEIGDSDPLVAMEEALRRQAADEVILSTLPPGASRWLRKDLLQRARDRVTVPVTHVYAEEPDRPEGDGPEAAQGH